MVLQLIVRVPVAVTLVSNETLLQDTLPLRLHGVVLSYLHGQICLFTFNLIVVKRHSF